MSNDVVAGKASFFKFIVIPFFVISIFAQSYSNAFLNAFLVDNSKAVELARTNKISDSREVSLILQNVEKYNEKVQGNISVTQTNGKADITVTGEFWSAGLRLFSIIVLYFWLRPFFAYLKKRNEKHKTKALNRYNNFYRGIFSYLLAVHVIWFFTATLKTYLPGDFWRAIVYHSVWWLCECYLFYSFLEPSLFMFVSGAFLQPGVIAPNRSSLSIYGRLLTMLIFLVLVPMGILAAYIYKDYFLLYDFKYNALLLLTTSIVFLVGNMQLLYKSVQEPIDVLAEKMQKLAEGDYSVSTSVLFNDEIGRLKANFNSMVEQLKEREEMKDIFGKYVSIEIAKHLIKNHKVDLGGENIIATVLFSDIRNFTSMSEKMSPEEVVTMLNTYFAYITEPIMANNGVINKFIGDAVMAVFTPHLGSENHVEDAIKAAKEMRERLANLNNSKELKSEIKFGIGLNTGPLIAGNIGTQKRFEYTVIGDTVNVASRMESLSKALEHDIILSESTAEKIDKEFAKTLILEKSDPVQIKGKSLPMPVYKLIGFKTD